MAENWKEMCQDSRKAAQQLVTAERWRSSISRSYYAAYAAVTGELAQRGVQFAYGGNNPAHADLPGYILHNLPQLSPSTRYTLAKAMRRLWKARVDADYVPSASLDRAVAMDALRDASRILIALEVEE